ncbi:heavy-metal-associated domain-containing protein [Paenarthrobacter ureafaciens]|uniref:heavy-metal-associated domain-containing protein n=1 Tax=Paenarthrobacter ureafaciens TaxID=37931 RepID=UPI00140E30E8|nr:heavy-metal-associated domain-containing protein [Paenarthrobacter ureafaciens]MCX8455043.1 heavy-metal-associated domain-containing protein [Paenarthrobacter ureafaciens]MCY0974459.1 heavy-metal-associated domain-containing protein [Paenarthrobacter ureafaciens]WNZ05068.1 heavy-metal-associated domain-containing protein [Paenarthrobacter ureafaciens]
MFESGNRTELPLAPSRAGCSCCAANVFSQPTSSAAEFTLEGLTCRHCSQTVEEAVLALEGVDSVAIELVPGGLSRVLVGGKAAGAAVRQAVLSAGYVVIGK